MISDFSVEPVNPLVQRLHQSAFARAVGLVRNPGVDVMREPIPRERHAVGVAENFRVSDSNGRLFWLLAHGLHSAMTNPKANAL